MSNYRQTKAKISHAKSENAYTNISTELTDKLLAGLAHFKVELSDIELRLVMKTNPPPQCFENCEIMDDRKRLMVIRNKIDMQGLTVPCEFQACAAKRQLIPIYLGQCRVCSNRVRALLDQTTPEGNLRYDLLTIRCLITRISYLEQQLTSISSGQLTKLELDGIVHEASALINL
jgi:hypothetical protein